MGITFKKFYFKYPNSDWVLKDINLNISDQEFALLAGPTGSGKSTLLYVLSGLVPKYVQGSWKGSVTIENISPMGNLDKLIGYVGIVLQNFEDQLFSLSVEEEIALGPINLNYPKDYVEDIVQRLLLIFGMTHIKERTVSSLSFGQKQRVAIASMLALNPRILLLDEPFSQIDDKSKKNLVHVLRKLNSDGTTIIVAEHDVKPLLHVVDRLILIRNGKIIYDGDPKVSETKLVDLGIRIRYPQAKHYADFGDAVLATNDLTIGWYGNAILGWINIYVREKEIVSIVGPNGSGKTTLGLTICGIIPELTGEIMRKQPISMIFQNPDNNLVFKTVMDEVLIPLLNSKTPDAESIALDLLETANLYKYASKSPHELSKGEKLKLAIISAIASKPRLIILDEPTFGQDYKSLESILAILDQYSLRFKFGVLILTNNYDYAKSVSDRIYQIKHGQVLPVT